MHKQFQLICECVKTGLSRKQMHVYIPGFHLYSMENIRNFRSKNIEENNRLSKSRQIIAPWGKSKGSVPQSPHSWHKHMWLLKPTPKDYLITPGIPQGRNLCTLQSKGFKFKNENKIQNIMGWPQQCSWMDNKNT